MHLKRLEIAGFKSFARRVILDFKSPTENVYSITAVVGPNGSGKSNIADAIRWVLGEQSLKNIRGKKNEDVIFGGSRDKGKLSVASVTMTLDNSDHRAPIEYEELEVTRRVYRDGLSEYVVNGQLVRLLDLQILLAQAQFGQGSYGIIGQGMIDRLLLQTPAERKTFFDEAVGIKEFQIKRHHAYLKLTRTQEHIQEANRLLQEVEPHLKNLRRQAKKLEERQEVELSLRDLEERYYATLLHTLNSVLDKHNAELLIVDKEYSDKQKKLTSVQTELATISQAASRENQFRELQEDYQRLSREKADLERERSALSSRLEVKYSQAGKVDAAWLERKLSELAAELSRLRGELASERDFLSVARQRRAELEKDLHELERSQMELETRRVNLEKSLFETRVSESDVPAGVLRSVAAILKNKQQFGGAVLGALSELGAVDETMRLALEVAAGAHMSSLVVENDSVAENCIRFLKERQLGVATFLPLTKIRPRPVVADIARLLGARGVYGLAVDLVKYQPELQNIFSYVFGSTLVVSDIASARDIGIGKVRMVTVDGDIMETSGTMKGGWRQKTHLGLHFGVGKRETAALLNSETAERQLQELTNSARSLERQLHEKQQRLVTLLTEEQTLERKIELVESREREIAKETATLESERKLSSLNSSGYGELMSQFTSQRDKIGVDILQLEKKILIAERQMAEFNNRQEAERQRVFSLQEETQSYQAALAEIVNRKNVIQLEIMKLSTRREDLEADIFNNLKEHAGLLAQKVKDFMTDEEQATARQEIEKLKFKLSLIGGIDGEVLKEYEITRDRYDKLTHELDDLTTGATNIQSLIIELDTIMKTKHALSMTRIKKEFSRYFSLLFDGGKAELVEVYGEESDNGEEPGEFGGDANEKNIGLLDNEAREDDSATRENEDATVVKKKKKTEILLGIEVNACPPCKKISSVAALSGGERTLTSIAMVCAILHTNPPPFVLLDEVEAALDEANTLRFNRILRELSTQSQFIVITHNRVTMHAADMLYGVTMGADGVSQLLSVSLDS